MKWWFEWLFLLFVSENNFNDDLEKKIYNKYRLFSGTRKYDKSFYYPFFFSLLFLLHHHHRIFISFFHIVFYLSRFFFFHFFPFLISSPNFAGIFIVIVQDMMRSSGSVQWWSSFHMLQCWISFACRSDIK